MRDELLEFAPTNPSYRLGLGFAGALVGVLAVGDAFHVIRLPKITLALPETPLADFGVFVVGVALFYTSYVFATSVTGDEAVASAGGTATVDVDARNLDRLEDLDPVHALKVRYAMGELDDEAFARKLRALKGEDVDVDAHSVDRDRFSDVQDKQTIIDQVENRQTVID